MTRDHVIDPGLERVGRLAARRLQRSGLTASGRVRLERITDVEVASLSGLLGARWRAPAPGTDATVDLAALDLALRDSWYGCTLADLAAAVVGGPLVDATAARRAAVEEREDGWARLGGHRAVAEAPALAGWLARERSTGAVARVAGGSPFAFLGQVLDLLGHLPADPPVSLVRFASRHCDGDPHALDRDRPLDAVLRRALSALDGEAGVADDVGSGSGAAAARRALYDRWGLSCDELSGTVLCLGVRPVGDARLARELRAAADAGEPRVLTLRELRGVDVLAAGATVHTCENPDVMAAAADALGDGCPPLVCTAGWPSTACLRLLRALVAGGAHAHHHGDLDRDGLRIVDHLLAVTNGAPWRMGADDHVRFAGGGASGGGGAAVPVRDPRLHPAAASIAALGRLVREEQMVEVLLADLRSVVDPGTQGAVVRGG